MKSPAIKFVALTALMLLMIAGVKSDTIVLCESEASDDSRTLVSTSKMMEAAEEQIRKEDEEETFKFPNVFDALRFIF